MGAAESRPVPSYHVISVETGSLAQELGIRLYFDFIISVNNKSMDSSQDVLVVPGHNVILLYSLLTNAIREVDFDVPEKLMIPSTPNGQAQPVGSGLAAQIGLTLRRCDPTLLRRMVWRCALVREDSPAWKAGLEAKSGDGDDFVLGCEGYVLRGGIELNRQLSQIAKKHAEGGIREALCLLVYRKSEDEIRRVYLSVPSESECSHSDGTDKHDHDHHNHDAHDEHDHHEHHSHHAKTLPDKIDFGVEWTEDDSIFAQVALTPVRMDA